MRDSLPTGLNTDGHSEGCLELVVGSTAEGTQATFLPADLDSDDERLATHWLTVENPRALINVGEMQ